MKHKLIPPVRRRQRDGDGNGDLRLAESGRRHDETGRRLDCSAGPFGDQRQEAQPDKSSPRDGPACALAERPRRLTIRKQSAGRNETHQGHLKIEPAEIKK
jgi:hypothetical protein